ncbi:MULTISPECIES: Eco57I restriction-modification methylase domain-containing protein [Microcystis]|uniref:site-specific DNA-methyltransferase (adenine-specific) n=1 Tax=Microcystis viridis FACHB-1342 TaxID=2692900 RepID=A0ABR8G9N4_MICVR|nr:MULTISPECIES: N-6 DNA methylase [Microcystis]MBD2599866.1 N-6 DNA methylase [Microcystis viridis FACHB-1342]MDB9388275.1 N-6 DNA methylase [Microcystis aeruginosa CS-583]ODV40052.1 putative type IIS restriction [Microcystis aeruginosa NIES-98]
MVQNLYSIVMELTAPSSSTLLTVDRTRKILNDFAYNFEWTPSDSLDIPSTNDFANAHLIVEHGLEHQAVITFLKRPYADLNYTQKKNLLGISYNNLLDWHIQVESEKILYVFNRCSPEKIAKSYPISRENLDNLRSGVFEAISGQRHHPNLPALDDALIETISFWKRNLYAEMEENISNQQFSALFNAIIFTRAVEDNYRRLYPQRYDEFSNSNTLFETFLKNNSNSLTIRESILKTLEDFGQTNIPEYLIDRSLLSAFDSLNTQTVKALLQDFYRIKSARPYEYDFSLISKHALSRIYERYTSILRVEESDQLSLFPPLPTEQRNKAYGSIYTPQFIARFFARYLREQMPPIEFQQLKTLEPAIGSGIFVRTLLEIQCDPMQGEVTTELIQSAFQNVFGLDVDPNACQAALLSLSLLHLVLTDQLPSQLSIKTAESIQYYQDHPELKESFSAVITNPHFVALSDQTEAMRKRIAQFMGDDGRGRIDLSLAFIKIALEVLKPGGYGLFVLPHKFLLSKSDAKIRQLITQEAWIRCLVDLSAIPIFGQVDTYIVLLIFQKRFNVQPEPLATISHCQELVGRALQDVVEGREVESQFYSVFKVPQNAFNGEDWLIKPPSIARIQQKLETLPKLSEFMNIRVGVQTGNNKVFIVSKSHIPKGEEAIFIPYLSDREMEVYTTPQKVSQYLFYPYFEEKLLEEDEIRNKYPKTWKYLLLHQEMLESRYAVKKENKSWWQLDSPRCDYLLRPKIISPHLSIMPRFSLDIEGKFAVIRSPIIYPKDRQLESDLLRYFVAILNSSICYRYISEHSHKYGSGYSMLEPKTLLKTPVPDPTKVSSFDMSQLLRLVDQRFLASGKEAIQLEIEIDKAVSKLYGFTEEDCSIYGV